MAAKRVTVADLPDSTLPESGGPGAGVFLYCPTCCERYSATRGDYFALGADHVLFCNGRQGVRHRRRNMILARESCSIVAA